MDTYLTVSQAAEKIGVNPQTLRRWDKSGKFTSSHQLAVEAENFGGGQTASKQLRKANILACGIGLPITPVTNDLNGLRLGTPEIVRIGMTPKDMPQLAEFISDALNETGPLDSLAREVSAFRGQFNTLHFVRT